MQEQDFKLKYLHGAAIMLVIYDMIAVNLSYLVGLWLRFDLQFSHIDSKYILAWSKFIPIYTLITLITFIAFKLYRSIWQFASYTELKHVMYTSIITGLLHTLLITLMFERMPIAYYLLGFLIQFLAVLGSRFSYRFVLLLRSDRENIKKSQKDMSRVMIVGAGNAGRLLLRDIKRSIDFNDSVVCFIDDDKSKWGKTVDNIPVVGGRNRILDNVVHYRIDKIYVAIPGSSPEELSKILNICK